MTSDAPLSRIERRKIEFRNRITDAAIKLFEEKGIADTSVASIVKEADIAHNTFFNHFPTKDHLLSHIVSQFGDNAYTLFRESFSKEGDPKKRLRFCLINIARALEQVNPHYKELLNVYLISGASASELRASHNEEFSGIIKHIMEDAQAKGELIAGHEVDDIVEFVVGTCVSTLLSWSLLEDFDIVEKMQKATALLNDTLFVEK